MRTLNLHFFRAAGACYDPATVLGEGWAGTILDILRLDTIPPKDRIWAATRKGTADAKTHRLMAVAAARTVQHLMTDQRSINVLDVAERYANGEATEAELSAARRAASVDYVATYAAPHAAAHAAAHIAADAVYTAASVVADGAAAGAAAAYAGTYDTVIQAWVKILDKPIKTT